MGRKPLPSAVHRANGSYRKDPARENKNEPVPVEGRPEMPARLDGNETAKTAWCSICNALEAEGRLYVSDGYVIEKIAMLEAFIGSAWSERDASLFNRLVTTHKSLISELGLTSSSRTKIEVHKTGEDQEDEIDAITAKLRSN